MIVKIFFDGWTVKIGGYSPCPWPRPSHGDRSRFICEVGFQPRKMLGIAARAIRKAPFCQQPQNSTD
jgi:hypothetical protein